LNQEAVTVGGRSIGPGSVRSVELPFARLPIGADMPIPVIVAHGRRPGPRLALTAALHGDELNGVEIVRQLMDDLDPEQLAGAVIALPVVNVFGFVTESRYLPDRRDLNRSFPGSANGSLAARLAHLLMTEIFGQVTHAIDLHTGSDHRANLPHIRGDLDNSETMALARAFGASLLVHARIRDGSLRQAAERAGVRCLVYEAGEPHRLNREAVRAGVAGVRRVMRYLEMLPNGTKAVPLPEVARETKWIRARRAGLFRATTELGQRVERGAKLGRIRDAFGEVEAVVQAPASGVVLGLNRNPIVHRGDAVVHLALVST